jgi:hypothetical protein
MALPVEAARPGVLGDHRLSGCSSMVEQQPSKLNTRVRFPSPAPASNNFLEQGLLLIEILSEIRFLPEIASDISSKVQHVRVHPRFF